MTLPRAQPVDIQQIDVAVEIGQGTVVIQNNVSHPRADRAAAFRFRRFAQRRINPDYQIERQSETTVVDLARIAAACIYVISSGEYSAREGAWILSVECVDSVIPIGAKSTTVIITVLYGDVFDAAFLSEPWTNNFISHEQARRNEAIAILVTEIFAD